MILTKKEQRELMQLARLIEKNIGSTDPRNVQRALYNVWVLRQLAINAVTDDSKREVPGK